MCRRPCRNNSWQPIDNKIIMTPPTTIDIRSDFPAAVGMCRAKTVNQAGFMRSHRFLFVDGFWPARFCQLSKPSIMNADCRVDEPRSGAFGQAVLLRGVLPVSSRMMRPFRLISRFFRGTVLTRQHEQIVWNQQLEDDLRHLVRLAIREDLGRLQDWTTVSLVPADARGKATAVTRAEGVVAGIRAGHVVLDEMETDARWQPLVDDGDSVMGGTKLATVTGSARDLLTSERTILNIMGRLSGVATVTRRYVDAVAGTRARICDTRKTTPAWRRLEKFAVRCGGGRNHRTGLFDAVLIKDNHLAFYGQQVRSPTPADAVEQARRFVSACDVIVNKSDFIIEIEVDSLDQLRNVLSAQPDIVLLDNMNVDELRSAVAIRDELAPDCELEASGGVSLQTVAAIAATGVERISVGALTHSAASLDIGLDWETED